jgi:DNA-binding GntR family transcriptional regulator
VEIKRHQDIYDAIRDQNSELAVEMMKVHFKMIEQN